MSKSSPSSVSLCVREKYVVGSMLARYHKLIRVLPIFFSQIHRTIFCVDSVFHGTHVLYLFLFFSFFFAVFFKLALNALEGLGLQWEHAPYAVPPEKAKAFYSSGESGMGHVRYLFPFECGNRLVFPYYT